MAAWLRRRWLTILLLLGLVCVGAYLAASTGVPKTGAEWKQLLVDAVQGADRVVVDGNPLPWEPPKPVFELTGGDKVEEFLAQIQIEDSDALLECGCYGDVVFRFHQGKRELAAVSHHHGTHLRWRDGKWPADAFLKDESQAALPAWLAKQGYSDLAEARKVRLAEEASAKAEKERFASFFPAGLLDTAMDVRPMDMEDPGGSDAYFRQMGDRLLAGMPDRTALTVACFQALGVSSIPWGVATARENAVLCAMSKVPTEDFLAGAAQLKENPEGLLGLARLFFDQRYSDRFPERERAEWAARLAETVLKTKSDWNKARLMEDLPEFAAPAVNDLLHRTLAGAFGEGGATDSEYSQEPGIRAGAALVLALQGDKSVKQEAERLLSKAKMPGDVGALEVTLALLGDPTYLKPEHFRIKSSRVQMAAVEAIGRFEGAHGLEYLMDAAAADDYHVRRRAIAEFGRILGRAWTQEQADSDRETCLAEMHAWWDAHGAEFVHERHAAAPPN